MDLLFIFCNNNFYLLLNYNVSLTGDILKDLSEEPIEQVKKLKKFHILFRGNFFILIDFPTIIF